MAKIDSELFKEEFDSTNRELESSIPSREESGRTVFAATLAYDGLYRYDDKDVLLRPLT